MSVTIKQIAEVSGLSWPTVSRILNNTDHPFREETKQRVRQIAEELGYRPHAAARMMRSRKSRQIGALLYVDRATRLAQHTMMETLMGVNEVLVPANYSMVMIPVPKGSGLGEVDVPAVNERLLDGLLVIDLFPPGAVERLETLSPKTVWVNANQWLPTLCVRRDEYDAGRKVATAMAAQGYRRLILVDYVIGMSGPHYSGAERRRGASDVAREHGLEVEEIAVPYYAEPAAVTDRLARGTDGAALIVMSVYLAKSLQSHLLATGWRPGVNFAMACCDDLGDLVDTWPQLARVSFDRVQMGRLAGEMMLRAVRHPAKEMASQKIVGDWVPGTTAPRADRLRSTPGPATPGATDRTSNGRTGA